MSNFKIELFNQLNRRDLVNFQNYISQAFHSKYILIEKKYLAWQYSRKFYILRSGKNIIGHFGFRDIVYKVFDNKYQVRVLMNLFVLEPYRLTGGAAALAAETLAAKTLRDPKYVLVFGYKKVASNMFGRIRPNWHDLGNLKRYLFLFNPKAQIFEGKAGPHVNDQVKNLVWLKQSRSLFSVEKKLDESYGDFWDAARARYGITAERTSDYVKWRFFDHPNLDYRFLSLNENGKFSGYLVWRGEADRGFSIARIIDLVSFGEGSDEALVGRFLKDAKAERYDAADFMFFGKAPEKGVVDSGFFDVSGTEFEDFPILFSPISFKKAAINIGGDLPIADFEDTYFTKADGDQDRPNPQP